MDGVSIGMTVTNVESILRLLQFNTLKSWSGAHV
jgi:hypothetical protein